MHNLTQEENSYYNCMHSMFNCDVAVPTHSMQGAYEVNGLFQQLTPNCYHPHPFPVTGDPGDLREKALIVLWHLVNKFQLIHSNVVRIYEDDFMEVETKIVDERFGIWFNKKIYPQPLAEFSCNNLEEMLDSIELKMETSDMDDPFKLWKIIKLVAHIEHEVDKSNMSQFFKDPQTNLPDDLKELVSDGMNNITQFLTVANDVLEALAIKVVPYQEVLKIICGGTLEKNCSFCSREVLISTEYLSHLYLSHQANVFFSPLLLGKYICGGQDCSDQSIPMVNNDLRFHKVLLTMRRVRSANMCDFCFKRTPIKEKGSVTPDIHRCSYCRKTMYCSMDCLHQDWKIHLKVCHKSKDGRKKKLGGSARRAVAKEKLEMMEKPLEEAEKENKDVKSTGKEN